MSADSQENLPSPSDNALGYASVRPGRRNVWRTALLLAASMCCGSLLFLSVPLAAIFICAAFTVVARAMRRTDASAMLGHLTNAVRLNLPLPQYLGALGKDGGSLGNKALDLREDLQRGVGVGGALSDLFPDLPEGALAGIMAAERTGRLAPALDRVRKQLEIPGVAAMETQLLRRFYPVLMLSGAFALVTGIMTFVVPKFRYIFEDFRTSLPLLTQLALGLSEYSVVFLMVFVAWVLWLLVQCVQMLAAGLGVSLKRPTLIPLRLRDELMWRMPVWGVAVRGAALSQVCRTLWEATAGGVPMTEALKELQRLPFNSVLNHRLTAWRERLVAGESMRAAAKAARMPALLVGFLGQAEASGSLPESLAFLTGYYEQQFSRAQMVISATVEPLIVMAVGAVVLVIELSIFLMMVKLIRVAGGMDLL